MKITVLINCKLVANKRQGKLYSCSEIDFIRLLFLLKRSSSLLAKIDLFFILEFPLNLSAAEACCQTLNFFRYISGHHQEKTHNFYVNKNANFIMKVDV